MTQEKQTLRDWLPQEAIGGEWGQNEGHMKYLDQEVITEYSLFDEDQWKSWPGKHLNVMSWCVLANGKAVGFNENPSRGWSFPVIGYKG